MLGNNFRPWGALSWVLNNIEEQKWSLLGCLSTEERCLSTLDYLFSRNKLKNHKFLKIIDPPSKFSRVAEKKLKERTDAYKVCINSSEGIEDHRLFEKYHIIVDSIEGFIGDSSGKVIVDISSFPKYFFFPIVRRLIESNDVTDLMVTYTVPNSYCTDSLAEDPKKWQSLPLFAAQGFPDTKIDTAVVGVGFLPFGLPELLNNEYRDASVHLLFPFPQGPPHNQRTWQFVQKIENDYPEEKKLSLVRVGVYDVSDAFDHICSKTTPNPGKTIFAPYGPKPISLAMCIYATLTNSPAYYTQPRVYNPDYCNGVRVINGEPEIYAYCLKLENRAFYKVEPSVN